MIVTEIYHGQGLGNQLWCYVVTRCVALDKGLEFGIMSPEKFKALNFMSVDFGNKVLGGSGPEGGPPQILPEGILHYYKEREIYYEKYKCDVSDFDQNLYNIADHTKIDGNFQSEKYIQHHKDEIRNWLALTINENIDEFSNENTCIINIRGGEYLNSKDLLLTKKYWRDAIKNMLAINKNMNFKIITDDVKYASKCFPEYPVYHFSIGKDYLIINSAYYLILSNSSFAFFPAWLNEKAKFIIAPKYWARHNISDGFWSCSFNLYSGWNWQDRKGNLFSSEKCYSELQKYNQVNKIYLLPARLPQNKMGFFRAQFNRLIYFVTKYKS
jgi:hypothetical protein